MSDAMAIAANHRLRQHLMRGITKSRNYAPDATLERIKRGETGPHSVQIGKIFAKWAAMWAEDMRALGRDGFEVEPDVQWKACMQSADDEVDRYLDANKLPRLG